MTEASLPVRHRREEAGGLSSCDDGVQQCVPVLVLEAQCLFSGAASLFLFDIVNL